MSSVCNSMVGWVLKFNSFCLISQVTKLGITEDNMLETTFNSFGKVKVIEIHLKMTKAECVRIPWMLPTLSLLSSSPDLFYSYRPGGSLFCYLVGCTLFEVQMSTDSVQPFPTFPFWTYFCCSFLKGYGWSSPHRLKVYLKVGRKRK